MNEVVFEKCVDTSIVSAVHLVSSKNVLDSTIPLFKYLLYLYFRSMHSSDGTKAYSDESVDLPYNCSNNLFLYSVLSSRHGKYDT